MPQSPIHQLEKGLGLKRTKGGSSDKELAYLVSRQNTKNLGTCLVFTAIVLLTTGVYMKSSVASAKADSASLRTQTLRLKSSMFRSKMGEMEAAKEGEAKLVKMLTNLQDHLTHDRGDQALMEDFQLKFGKAVKQHKRMMKVELKKLGGNEKVKAYLSKTLEKAVDEFYYIVSAHLRATGSQILDEGSDSKARAQLLVESFMKDLSAEVSEEKQVAKDFEKLESSDPQWKKMSDKYKKESHPETQDEKDEETMM
jgi:hypothetical protein